MKEQVLRYITLLDFWKLMCLWDARRFGDFAFSPRGTWENTQQQRTSFGLSTFVKPKEKLNNCLRDVLLHSSDFLQRSCMIEAQMGRLGPIFFCEANFLVAIFS